jgi:hypothetical protein
MLSKGDLKEDEVKDSILYLLESKRQYGRLPREATIHIRRLKNKPGFES